MDFAGGGGGLTPAQVDARVKPYAHTGGRGISHTDLDSSTETELRDSVPYDGPTFAWPTLTLPSHSGQSAGVDIRDRTAQRNDARLDAAEAFEGVLRSRTNLRTAHRIDIGTANVAYALGASLPLTGPDFELVVVVAATSEPDGHLTTTRDALVAAGSVTRANAPLTAANGLEFVNAPDNNRLRLGIDTGGNLYGGSDTVDTIFWTVDRFDIDTTGALQFGAGGDVAFARDATDDLIGDIRPGVVDVAAVRFDAGTAVAGRYVALNSDATGFEGVAAPTGGGGGDITGVTAGAGLTGGGTTGAVTLAVQAGQGIELSGGVAVDLDGSTLSKSATGLRVADGGIGAPQIRSQSISSAQLANAAVETSEIADAAVTAAKLAADVEIPTVAEIQGIVRRDEAQRAIDRLATFGSVDPITFAGTFTIGGVEWEFSDADDYSASDDTLGVDLVQSGDPAPTITQAQVDELLRYSLWIGTSRFAFADGGCDLTEIDRSLDCTFRGVASNPWVSGAVNTIIVGEPLTPDNYVCDGGAPNDLMTRQTATDEARGCRWFTPTYISGISADDEGAVLGDPGQVRRLDCRGAGVTCTEASGTVTVTVPGAAATPTSIGTARGPEWFGLALPETALANTNGRLPLTFTRTAAAPRSVSAPDTSSAYAPIPFLPPSTDIIGLWAVSSIGGVELAAVLIDWGPNDDRGGTYDTDEDRLLVKRTSAIDALEVNVRLSRYFNDDFLAVEVSALTGQTTVAPAANTAIKIYPAVVGRVADASIDARLAAREWDGTATQFAGVTRTTGVTYFVRP